MNPIALRITYPKERRELLTGLGSDKKDWVPEMQQVNPATKLAILINKELFSILQKVTERFQQLKYSGQDFTIDELVDKVRGKEPPLQSLTGYMDMKLATIASILKLIFPSLVKSNYLYKHSIRGQAHGI